MIRNLLLLFIIICCSSFAKSQNLLPDGGFELLDSCPSSYFINDNQYWTNCTWGTPDQFDTCNGVPQNNVGWQKPHGGHGYSGLVTFGRYGYREYMHSILTSPMQDAKTYCIEFWISLADYSLRPSWAPQLYFSSSPITANMDTNFTVIPQWQDTSFLCGDTANWVKVTGVFNCLGNYNYVTVGNFYNNAKTNSPPIPNALANAYYYIDDMKIEECNPAKTNALYDIHKPRLLENPAEDRLAFEFPGIERDGTISIYDMQGRKVLEQNLVGNKTMTIPVKSWKRGSYFYNIKLENGSYSGIALLH